MLMESLIKTGFIISFVLAVLSIFAMLDVRRKERTMFGRAAKNKPFILDQLPFVKELHRKLDAFLAPKNKTDRAQNYIYTTLALCGGTGIYLLFQKQVILGFAAPVILFKFVEFCIITATRQAVDEIEAQLPQTIDRIILNSGRYNDLKTILYKTAAVVPNPMKSILETTALQMNASDPREILMEVGNFYNNIWVWSFIFILISSFEDSTQEEVLESLRNLRNLLERENQNQKQQKLDRKFSIATYYVLAAIGILSFFLNLIFNPIANSFFFGSIGGLGALIAGFFCIFLTIIINIRLTYRKN